MKTSLFSEEGRAARGGRGPLMAFLVAWALICVGAGYLVFKYHTKPNLTPLQRVYLPQYRNSFYRSTFTPFNPQSTYWILDRKVIDPKTKQAVVLGCTEDMVRPDLEEDGNFHIIKTNDGVFPSFVLKSEYVGETLPKTFIWDKLILKDKFAYDWHRQHI